MNQIKFISEALNTRFPKGNDPYQIATRLAEECGEVAKEINHWEASGIKNEKYGEPSKEKLAGEIKNVLTCAYQVALYYDIEKELLESIEKSIQKINHGNKENK